MTRSPTRERLPGPMRVAIICAILFCTILRAMVVQAQAGGGPTPPTDFQSRFDELASRGDDAIWRSRVRPFHGIRGRGSLHHMTTSVRPQPLLAVRDVRASARWYATLLGATRTSELASSEHEHLYDRILVDGALVLQLHAWNEEDHPNLVDPDSGRNGHGVLVWFELDDLDAAVDRARALRAEIVEDVHVNPAPGHREMWLRDPDGYLVVICSPDGEATR